MNLIEARKLGHEGWIYSPTRSKGEWVVLWPYSHFKNHKGDFRTITIDDICAEDWEPKPKPEPEARNLYEFEIWFNIKTGKIHEFFHFGAYERKTLDIGDWRKIRVREVVE